MRFGAGAEIVFLNKYILQSVWILLGWRKASIEACLLCYYWYITYSFKFQYMAVAGAGAEIRDKGGAGAENK